jgi:hypothetical protein
MSFAAGTTSPKAGIISFGVRFVHEAARGKERWERQSPDWRITPRQSGDWRSRTQKNPGENKPQGEIYNLEMNSLVRGRFCPDDFVPFDDRGNPHAGIVALWPFIYSYYLAHRADENFRSASDFGRQRQSDIEFRPGSQILINRKINATR